MSILDERDTWLTATCSVARALDALGAKSSVLVLREAFFGTRRFDDFVRRVGLGEPATAVRLKELVAAGLLERVPYREPGQRTRYEYQLTRKGEELLPVVTALREWGDAWAADEAGPTLDARHHDCGATVHTRLRCDNGHDVRPDEIDIEPGPGFPAINGTKDGFAPGRRMPD
jgi:DNA-binding HxlR family transcriptional regulator